MLVSALVSYSIQKGESKFRSIGVENGAVIDNAFNKGIIDISRVWGSLLPPIQKGDLNMLTAANARSHR